MKTSARNTVILCIAAAVFPGCSTPLSKQNVVGTYKGTYAGGAETFTIRADGTFAQAFSRNGRRVYVGQGKWDIEDKKTLRFYPFIQPGDDMTLKGKPQHFGVSPGVWDGMYPRIIFSDHNNYWIIKQKP